MKKVSFLRLMGAIFYDLLLVFSFVFTLIGIAVMFNIDGKPIFWLITLPASYFYFVYSWVKTGQTLGMKSWRIKITKTTYKSASIRFIASILSWLFFGIGYFFVLFNSENRSFHDIISKTYLKYLPKNTTK